MPAGAHVHLPVGRQLGRAHLLEHRDGHERAYQQDEHGREHGAPLAAIHDEAAEAEHARHGDEQQRQALHQVGEGRGVLERASRVHAVVAAAVRAQLLDGDLAGLRAPRHCRLVDGFHGGRIVGIDDAAISGHADRLQQLHRLVLVEILRRALLHVDHRHHKRQRDEHEQHRARHIDPEVSEARIPFAHDAAEQREQNAQAHGGRDEVLHRQADRLGEVAERAVAAVRLPVRVRHEADGGVEREIPGHPGNPFGVERQQALQHENGEQPDQADRRKRERTHKVALPPHVLGLVYADAAVDRVLHRNQHPREHGLLTGHDLVEVRAQRDGQSHQQRQVHAVFEQLVYHRSSPPLRSL